MNEFLLIGLTACAASLLTFFSGFGLGTLLTPVFMLCGFDLQISIALTAVVHLLNNLFKLLLTGKHFNKEVVLKFGIPAIAGAFIGSFILGNAGEPTLLYSGSIGSTVVQVELFKLIIAIIMIVFALMEIMPALNFSAEKKWLPFGGVLSGFFGGLTGHQGALRSAFLMKLGLTKESFIASGIAIACMIDISRLSVYADKFAISAWQSQWQLLLTATLSAFIGAVAGQQLLKKITIRILHLSVSILIILFSFALALGLI